MTGQLPHSTNLVNNSETRDDHITVTLLFYRAHSRAFYSTWYGHLPRDCFDELTRACHRLREEIHDHGNYQDNNVVDTASEIMTLLQTWFDNVRCDKYTIVGFSEQHGQNYEDFWFDLEDGDTYPEPVPQRMHNSHLTIMLREDTPA